MHDLIILAIKGVAGGVLVVGFALLAQGLKPKRFAGLFSAAPAVALVGLTVVVLDKGAGDARHEALGMIAGAAGMIAYAICVVPLLRRANGTAAAAAALLAWAAVAAVVALPVMLG